MASPVASSVQVLGIAGFIAGFKTRLRTTFRLYQKRLACGSSVKTLPTKPMHKVMSLDMLRQKSPFVLG